MDRYKKKYYHSPITTPELSEIKRDKGEKHVDIKLSRRVIIHPTTCLAKSKESALIIRIKATLKYRTTKAIRL